MLTLENNWLKVNVKQKGAEICNLIEKTNNVEHIWQADPLVWNRHAPILFPIVGQVENNTYTVEGKDYKLPQHGFARDKEFSIESQTTDSIVLVVESDSSTLEIYPFQFRLYVSYTLLNDKVEIEYRVVNIDSKTIYFSIGAHPGFVCPFGENESFGDYILEFEKDESADRLLFEAGLLNGKMVDSYLNGTNTIQLSYDVFKDDAIILKNLKSDYVDLENTKTGKKLRFFFRGFPLLAFWTKPGMNAPFLCIEPWYGVADTKGQN